MKGIKQPLAWLILIGIVSFKPLTSIYKNGWIDLNKNGKKDIYEDPTQSINARTANLLSQMTLEEKTCQMATLYGWRRVLKDSLPKPEWKNAIWKDGIANIDEHINGYQGGRGVDKESGVSNENPNTWPASAHAKAMNEVQRWFIEQTRLGIPVDFSNEGIRGLAHLKATCFPSQNAMGATWDRKMVRRQGEITAIEGRA